MIDLKYGRHIGGDSGRDYDFYIIGPISSSRSIRTGFSWCRVSLSGEPVRVNG
jgi:hypothetical protein